MAYTIISQNNSTTTLSDGVNTITVPSRVNLTSGNFTIVEVNNNMATLEDGDGNVYRDIPCVATLVDAGGGGSALPDQTGHSGEFLTTDGTDASWSDKPLVNTATQSSSLSILGNAATGLNSLTILAKGAGVPTSNGVVVLNSSFWYTPISVGFVSIGTGHGGDLPGFASISIKGSAKGSRSIQLGEGTNPNDNTFRVANANGNFEIMSADGTIPTARLTNAINKYSSMPTAGADYLGQIAQFTGTTDATYTHGYIYECVSDGGNPATYSWTAVQVQAGGGGGIQNLATGYLALTILGDSSVNDSTINIGAQSDVQSDYSIAVGTYARVSYSENSLAIGYNCAITDTTQTTQYYNTVIGYAAQIRNASNGIVIGNSAFVNANGAMQFGMGANSEAGTVCFALTTTNDDTLPPNYKLLDSDGTIPADRLASTSGLADGNYRLRLTMASGVPTLSWVAE